MLPSNTTLPKKLVEELNKKAEGETKNNLTTVDAGGVLDARQGKVLDDRITGISTRVTALEGASGGGGLVVSATAPADTGVGWIDTSVGGVLKYYDAASSSWKAAKAVWG